MLQGHQGQEETYYSNAKTWMDLLIMSDILTKLNRKFAREKRNVLLFLDNVSSHSPDLVGKFSNIKVVFLPNNTTSRLQPSDAGIIKNFKVHYRKVIVKHALAKVNGSSLTSSQITKSVDLLTSIRWVKQAWDGVKSDTITNCFKHCGFQEGMCVEETTDPFADIDGKENGDSEDYEEIDVEG